ncbi:hypothetical protein E4J89_15030 [Arthrobacter sp. CAU 1506]|uniref:hypothetical protein n=1 Tax=Arthrobacter sp. CAU 1506 TaxID=2560052 RepID=UPI0010AB790F|nr:hypothetical protein [Arthrobacter sp. CAU 1506]TJY67399.1 hypothetical protein E4J89_15030 [Arthrobacter sp. CAU 1506]
MAVLLLAAPIAVAPANASPITRSVTTTIAATTAVGKAKITASPKSAIVAKGKTHSFKVKATGSKLKYQWHVKKPKSSRWAKATGSSAKTKTLKVKADTGLNGAQFRVVVSNSRGKTTSRSAKLSVVASPKITTQPKSVTVAAKSKVALSVKASGGSMSYQWQSKAGSKWANISKATRSTHSFTAPTGQSAKEYRVIASNKAGKTASKSVKVTTVVRPTVKIPGSVHTTSGKSVTIKSQATGGSLSYQWERGVAGAGGKVSWTRIPGATGANYTFTAKSKNELDAYRVTVKNKAGKATSSETLLLVFSTKQDPFPIDKIFSMPDWLVTFFEPGQYPSDRPGKVDLFVDLALGNISDDVIDPADWIVVDYIGNNGRIYNDSGFTVTDSYRDIGPLLPMDFDVESSTGYGVVFADVPANAVKGGVWRITDHYDGSVEYVKGF